MRELPPGLQAHLDSGATTLAWCWRLTRRDGRRLGFTDHDKPLTFDATTFEAATGFATSELKQSLGLAVDNLDVASALRSDSLDETALAAGLFDDARVEIFRVNWQDVTQRVLLRVGSIGEVRRAGQAFTAEVRGLAHYLQQPRGRAYQRSCDADLGDARCGIDLSSAAHSGTGAVTALDPPRTLVVSGLSSFAAGRLERGVLRWTSGPNAGAAIEIKRHGVTPTSGPGGQIVTLELWQPMAHPVEAGHAFTATVGCDKTFATCRTVFANTVNFRGFPHIPGADYIALYPNRSDPVLDGSSLFKKIFE